MEDYFLLCRQKQSSLEEEFFLLPSLHAKYDLLIARGKPLLKQHAPMNTSFTRVRGCQSETFLEASLENSLIWFSGQSNSLISSGLLCILIETYSGLPPSIILTCFPDMIRKVGFHEFLSLNRANGLHQIYLHMKQKALHFLVNIDANNESK